MNTNTIFYNALHNIIVQYFLGALTSLEIIALIFYFYSEKYPLKNTILFVFIPPLFISFIHFIIPSTLTLTIIKTLITCLLFILNMLIILKVHTLKKALLYFTSYFVFIAIPAFISGHIITITDLFNIAILKEHATQIFTHISVVFIFLISATIKSFIKPKNNSYKGISSIIIFQAILILAIIATYFKVTFDMFSNRTHINILSSLTVQTLIIVPFIFLSLYNITLTIKNIRDNMEFDMQKFYNKTLDNALQNVRETIHAHANSINLIYWYVESNEIDELKQYLLEISPKYKNRETRNAIMFENIKNATLLGVLSAKYNEALEKNIIIDIQSSKSNCEVNEIKIKMSHLSNIIGVFMDNAIEAAEISNEKLICIDINCFDNVFSIKISNSILNTPDLTMINKKDWSTKGERRGIGLYDVQKTLKKYKNANNYTHISNSMFVQELIIS